VYALAPLGPAAYTPIVQVTVREGLVENSVPEPSLPTLLGLSVIGVIAYRYRRQSSAD
jgi:hypothetical protein